MNHPNRVRALIAAVALIVTSIVVSPTAQALAATLTPAVTVPSVGSWGFDMNGNGCSGTSFASGAAPVGIANAAHLGFDAIQLNGWGWAPISADDPCYKAQLQWYQQNNPGSPIQFIMFPVPFDSNACDSYSTSPSDGYDAGSAQAQFLYQQAVSNGLPVTSGPWWLDVEQTTDCGGWNFSDSAINVQVLQGAIDYLHAQGLTVGIYSDSWDWNQITNSNRTQFASIPAWDADLYDGSTEFIINNDSGQNPYSWPTLLSWVQSACGSSSITGGPLWVVQYMWGNANKAPYFRTDQAPAILGRDFDYQCQSPGTGGGKPTISATSGTGAMASTETLIGANFGATQASGSYVHLWFTADNPQSCAVDNSTISWGAPGNWGAFTVSGWSNTTVKFQVPTASGPNRQLGSTLGTDLWLIPAGDKGCVTVTTSAGTSNTMTFTAANPATTTNHPTGWTVGMTGPGVYGLRGGNQSAGTPIQLVCSYGGGQAILDQQGAMYPIWDLVSSSGTYYWVWDGMMDTPPGGLSTQCSSFPAVNPVPASINAIAGVSEFRMGQPMNVFGSGFGSSIGSGYVHLWTNNTAGSSPANCGNGSTTSTNWGEPGNSAAFTRDSWSATRVVFGVPTPSGPGHIGSNYQIRPGNWGCVTIINSSGGSTWAGQYAIFVGQSPVAVSYTTSGAANIRTGPTTSAASDWTASSGQSLSLICYDAAGQVVNGYGTWDQLSSGEWVWDGLMNTPQSGPTGVPACANYPADL